LDRSGGEKDDDAIGASNLGFDLFGPGLPGDQGSIDENFVTLFLERFECPAGERMIGSTSRL
jgi:hypothetical protein